MQRREIWLLILAAIILMYIIPYFIIIDGSGTDPITGAFSVLWDFSRRVLPENIAKENLLPPAILTLVMLAPGLYYIFTMTKEGEKPQYLHQMIIIFVISWSALLFLVPSSIWSYEGISLKPEADYWITLPNFVTLSLILFVLIPSLMLHQSKKKKTALDIEVEKKRPIYRQPGVILALVILFIPDFISFHTHSTRIWNSQTYLEFGTIGYTLSIQFVRTFNQTNTSLFLIITPAPTFPAFILRWIICVGFSYQVLAYLKDETTHKQAIIVTLLSVAAMLFLSIMYSTDFLVGDYFRYPIPFPILQLAGFSLIQNHLESKQRVAKDPEQKIIKIPLVYILYSKFRKQIEKESEVT